MADADLTTLEGLSVALDPKIRYDLSSNDLGSWDGTFCSGCGERRHMQLVRLHRGDSWEPTPQRSPEGEPLPSIYEMREPSLFGAICLHCESVLTLLVYRGPDGPAAIATTTTLAGPVAGTESPSESETLTVPASRKSWWISSPAERTAASSRASTPSPASGTARSCTTSLIPGIGLSTLTMTACRSWCPPTRGSRTGSRRSRRACFRSGSGRTSKAESTTLPSSTPDRIRSDAARAWRLYFKLLRNRNYEPRGAAAAWAANEYRLGKRKTTLRRLARRGELPGYPTRRQTRFVTELDGFLRRLGYAQ